MGSLYRQFERRQDKVNQKQMKKMYGKKPKEKCPICKKYSLFFENNKGTFCVNCDSMVKAKDGN